MKTRQIITVIRWLAAAALFFTAYRRVTGQVGPEMALGDPLPLDISSILSGVGFLMGGAACIAPELVEWGSWPFRVFFNSIFFPGRQEIPPPDYNLPLLYREQGRYPEALEGYFKILKHHPQELLAYIEGIQTSFECGDEASADKFLRMGQRDLAAPEVRQQLQQIVDACKAQAALVEAEGEPDEVEELPPRSES